MNLWALGSRAARWACGLWAVGLHVGLVGSGLVGSGLVGSGLEGSVLVGSGLVQIPACSCHLHLLYLLGCEVPPVRVEVVDEDGGCSLVRCISLSRAWSRWRIFALAACSVRLPSVARVVIGL